MTPQAPRSYTLPQALYLSGFVFSHTEALGMIRAGRVRINSDVVKDPTTHVRVQFDRISIGNKQAEFNPVCRAAMKESVQWMGMKFVFDELASAIEELQNEGSTLMLLPNDAFNEKDDVVRNMITVLRLFGHREVAPLPKPSPVQGETQLVEFRISHAGDEADHVERCSQCTQVLRNTVIRTDVEVFCRLACRDRFHELGDVRNYAFQWKCQECKKMFLESESKPNWFFSKSGEILVCQDCGPKLEAAQQVHDG